MDDLTNRKPRLIAPPMDGILEPYASDYDAQLAQGGYAATTRHAYLCCVGHFACWLRTEHVVLQRLDEEAARRFVTEHLPRCNCPPPFRRSPHIIRAALSHLYNRPVAKVAIHFWAGGRAVTTAFRLSCRGQTGMNPASMLTRPAMIEVLVSCVGRGLRKRSDAIRKRFMRPIRCSTATRKLPRPRLYCFSSSSSSPPLGFL